MTVEDFLSASASFVDVEQHALLFDDPAFLRSLITSVSSLRMDQVCHILTTLLAIRRRVLLRHSDYLCALLHTLSDYLSKAKPLRALPDSPDSDPFSWNEHDKQYVLNLAWCRQLSAMAAQWPLTGTLDYSLFTIEAEGSIGDALRNLSSIDFSLPETSLTALTSHQSNLQGIFIPEIIDISEDYLKQLSARREKNPFYNLHSVSQAKQKTNGSIFINRKTVNPKEVFEEPSMELFENQENISYLANTPLPFSYFASESTAVEPPQLKPLKPSRQGQREYESHFKRQRLHEERQAANRKRQEIIDEKKNRRESQDKQKKRQERDLDFHLAKEAKYQRKIFKDSSRSSYQVEALSIQDTKALLAALKNERQGQNLAEIRRRNLADPSQPYVDMTNLSLIPEEIMERYREDMKEDRSVMVSKAVRRLYRDDKLDSLDVSSASEGDDFLGDFISSSENDDFYDSGDDIQVSLVDEDILPAAPAKLPTLKRLKSIYEKEYDALLESSYNQLDSTKRAVLKQIIVKRSINFTSIPDYEQAFLDPDSKSCLLILLSETPDPSNPNALHLVLFELVTNPNTSFSYSIFSKKVIIDQ